MKLGPLNSSDSKSPLPQKQNAQKNYESKQGEPQKPIPREPIFAQSKIIAPGDVPRLNTPRMQCYYHYDQQITMFCKNTSCSLPLCPQCIKIHTQEHSSSNTYAIYETIDNCITDQYSRLQASCNKIAEEYNRLQQITGNTGDGLAEQLEKLQEAKLQTFKIVEGFFDTLERELRQEMSQNHDYLANQSKSFLNYLQNRHRQLNVMKEKLLTQKGIKQLIKIYQNDVERENELYIQESKHFEKQLHKFNPSIIIDQAGIYQLNLDLAKFVNLKAGNAVFVGMNKNKMQDEVPQNKSMNNMKPLNPYERSEISRGPHEVHKPQQPTPAEKLHPYLLTPPRAQGYDRKTPSGNFQFT